MGELKYYLFAKWASGEMKANPNSEFFVIPGAGNGAKVFTQKNTTKDW